MNIINSKSEIIIKKPAFLNLIRSHCCIVITDGYYEWMVANTVKQPFYIKLPKYQILPFAGLWDEWIDEKKNKCFS